MTEQEWLVCDSPAAMLAYVRPMADPAALRCYVELANVADVPLGETDEYLDALELPETCNLEDGDSESLANILRDVFGNPFRCQRLCNNQEFTCSLCGGKKTAFSVKRVPVRGPDDVISEEICIACNGSGTQTHDTEDPCKNCRRIVTPDVKVLVAGMMTPKEAPVVSASYYHGTGQVYDFSDMPILHDALIDAGCQNEEVLLHLRGLERCECLGGICPDCSGSGELYGNYFADDGMEQCERCRGKGEFECWDCEIGWRPRNRPFLKEDWLLRLIKGAINGDRKEEGSGW